MRDTPEDQEAVVKAIKQAAYVALVVVGALVGALFPEYSKAQTNAQVSAYSDPALASSQKSIVHIYEWDGVWAEEEQSKGVSPPGSDGWSAEIDFALLIKDYIRNENLFSDFTNLQKLIKIIKSDNLFDKIISGSNEEITMVKITKGWIYFVINNEDSKLRKSPRYSRLYKKNIHTAAAWINISYGEYQFLNRYTKR